MSLDVQKYAVEIKSSPTVIYQGDYSSEKIKISVSASPQTLFADVNLYSSGSNSIPYSEHESMWSNLIPTWRFLNDKNEVVETVHIKLNKTDNPNISIGSCEVLYVDDMPTTDNPVTIIATLEASGIVNPDESFTDAVDGSIITHPSYANSKVGCACNIKVSSLSPSTIEVTRNGFSPYSEEIYWRNMKNPFILSIFGEYPTKFQDKIYDKSMLYQFPYYTSAVITPDITISAVDLNGESHTTSAYCEPFKCYDNEVNYFRTGGYAIGYFTPDFSSNNVYITASASYDYDDNWTFPNIYINPESSPNSLMSVSITKYDKTQVENFNKIIKNQGFMNKSIDDSILDNLINPQPKTLIDNVSNIYAVDLYHNIWIVSSDHKTLYKISENGTIKISKPLSEIFETEIYIQNISISLDNKVSLIIKNKNLTKILIIDGISGEVISLSEHNDINCFITQHQQSGFWVIHQLTENNFTLESLSLDTNHNYRLDFTQNNFSILDCFTYNNIIIIIGNQSNKLSKILLDTKNKIKQMCTFNQDNLSFVGWNFDGNQFLTIKNQNVFNLYKTTNIVSTDIDLLLENQNGSCKMVIPNQQISLISDNEITTLNSNKDTYKRDFTLNTNSLNYKGDTLGVKLLSLYKNSKSKTHTIKTTSGPFIVDEYNYRIRKFNDSWNAVAHMRYATNVAPFKENENLFSKFIGASFGGSNTLGEYSLGRKIYESIANQVSNIHDIDECNILSVSSLAKKQDVPMDNFNLTYPEELNRAMDLLSVSKEKLWGDRCHCNSFYFIDTSKDKNIKRFCIACGHEHKTNLGNSADDFISIKLDDDNHPPYVVDIKHQRGNYLKITPSKKSIYQSKKILDYLNMFVKAELKVDSMDEITLEKLEDAILNAQNERAKIDLTMFYSLYLFTLKDEERIHKLEDENEIKTLKDEIKHKHLVAIHTNLFTPQPWTNYCYFQYINRECKHTSTGVINWDDKNTTLDEHNKSTSEWLGENKTMERIFSYILHKNLGFNSTES